MNTTGTPGHGTRPMGHPGGMGGKPKGKNKFTLVTVLMWIITALIGWAVFTNIKP